MLKTEILKLNKERITHLTIQAQSALIQGDYMRCKDILEALRIEVET